MRKSNCLKPLKLILLSNFCEKVVAKTKNLGIVIMNKMIIKLFILFEMGNEHPSFFKLFKIHIIKHIKIILHTNIRYYGTNKNM